MHLRIFMQWLMALVSLAGLAMAAPAAAQTYPAKAVKLIVPFPPGGPTDVMGRIFADKLSAMWNQPVVVENRGGAGGNIGSELTAKAPPDGYTLLLAASSHVTNGALYNNLPYDPIKDFTPISEVAYYSLVLVAHPTVPANTLKELVALAKTTPGKLTFGSAGSGTPTHLTAELFGTAAGIQVIHVPYKGAGPATNDLIGGQLQLMFNNPVSALPHVKSGRLKALATTGTKRAALVPDVPTIAESGYPGFEAGTWFLILGPAGIAKPIQSKLAHDVIAVLKMDDVRERFAKMGVEPIGTTPDQLTVRMRDELEKWGKVIRAAKIKVD